jgi:uncharacterized membrane protein
MTESRPSNLKVFFKRGLRALLPTVLTVAVFVLAINFLYDNIAKPINSGMKAFLLRTAPGHAPLETFFDIDLDDAKYQLEPGEDGYEPDSSDNTDYARAKEDLDKRFHNWIGFVLAIALVFVFGFVLATFVGSRVFHRVESLIEKFPGVKVVYPYAKQIVEFFTSERKIEFHSVVAFEWPRKGIWAIGFVTGNGFTAIDRRASGRLVNVFLPSCPTPVTGYVLFVPVEDLLLLPISVDDAIRFIISGGVLVPESERVDVEKTRGLSQARPVSVQTVEDEPEPDDQGEPEPPTSPESQT